MSDVYQTSGPPGTSPPVAPTLADAVTAAQTGATTANEAAIAAAASAAAAALSAEDAASSLGAVETYEATVVADLASVQADLVTVVAKVTQINALATTLIGDLGAAQGAASSASAAATAALNSANTASSAASTASGSAGDAASSAETAAGYAASLDVATLLAKANNLSDVANAAAALGHLGGAPLNSPTFTGTPATVTVALASDATTKIASTAFVWTAIESWAAPLNSPGLTGTPTAPTVSSAADSTTKLATTAFVQAAIAAVGPAPVASVFGRTGAVASANNDYSFSQISGSVASVQMPALTGAVTTMAGSTVTTLANVPNDTLISADLLVTATAAPAAPSNSGFARVWLDSTNQVISSKYYGGTVSITVVPASAPTNQFGTGIGANGQQSFAQPSFANLSGTASMAQMPADAIVASVEAVIDGGGSALATTTKPVYLEVAFPCTINRVTLLADVSGSVTIDIWKVAYGSFPPSSGNSITASDVPAIASAQTFQDSTLTGWTTAISAGDILAFAVKVNATNITRCACSLKVTKT